IIGRRPRGRKRLGMLNEFLRVVICGTDEKGGKQERVENMEAKNLPNGRTLTTIFFDMPCPLCHCANNTIFIHSFIPGISTAPLQVLYYSEALPTTARILYRSFTPKRTPLLNVMFVILVEQTGVSSQFLQRC